MNPFWRLVRRLKMSADERCPKNEFPSRAKMNEILGTISQPRTLSANIPACQKGVYLFYSPLNKFHIAHNNNKKKKTLVKKALLNVMVMLRIFIFIF